MKTTLNLNVATISEELITRSQIDNSNNKYKITNASCTLIRKIRLKARELFIPHSRVYTQQVIYKLKSLSIGPGNTEAQHLNLGMSLTESQDLWMQPPVASEVVDCDYDVRVTLEFDNFCGCGNYYVSLPLEICNGTNVVHEKLSQPPNLNVEWSPMMLSDMRVHTADFSNIHTGEEGHHANSNQITHATPAKAEPNNVKPTKSDDKSEATFVGNQV